MTNEIAMATDEQSHASKNIKENMANIEEVTIHAAERAESAHASSNMLTSLSKKLGTMVSGLRVKSDDNDDSKAA